MEAIGWVKTFLVCSLIAALGACGGGSHEEPASHDSSPKSAGSLAPHTHQASPTAPISIRTIASLQEGARLNAGELARIAKTGVIPKAFEGPLLSGAKKNTVVRSKSAASRTAAYRFFNTRTSAHFYTTSTSERDSVIANLPFMSFEGPAFHASDSTVPGLSPVHRFYNTQTDVHFYTISEAERAHVVATLPQFHYEGIAYHASTLPGTGYTPLYRFFYTAKGFHFYTNSLSERDHILATLPQYNYEGVGYYVLGEDWQTPAIPHSGISSSQCFQAGSDTFVACSSAGALALNTTQDGHRAAINPMTYSGVPIFQGESAVHPSTECVKDDVTGLVWEGKTATGARAGSSNYTHFGNNAASDASGYATSVNNTALCGFSDWRLPTAEELQGLLNHGVVGGGPNITTARFPNTQDDEYWTSSAYAGAANHFWSVGFSGGYASFASASTAKAVRLVRGAAWAGPRYLIGTESYAGDAADNVVIDRQTGLVWRRCLEGEAWSGSACNYAGPTTFYFSHEEALERARSQSGWRLPNIKELGSFPDRARVNPAHDPVRFPSALGGEYLWSSTPYVPGLGRAQRMDSRDGSSSEVSRGAPEFISAVRLVRSSP